MKNELRTTVSLVAAVALSACGDATTDDGSANAAVQPTSMVTGPASGQVPPASPPGASATPTAANTTGNPAPAVEPGTPSPQPNTEGTPTNTVGAPTPVGTASSQTPAVSPPTPVAPTDPTPMGPGPMAPPGGDLPSTPGTPSEPAPSATTPSTPSTPSGQAGMGSCTFQVDAEVSSAISTVGIVNWSTDMTGVSAARIEFGPQGSPATMTAPVEASDGEHRTLLLGMKGSSNYSFYIVVEAGGQTCSSEEYSIETGPVHNDVPVLDMDVRNAAAVAPGFMVLSAGIGNLGGGGFGGGGGGMVYIVDQDGDPVWWADAPDSTSRARMDWEGNNMWMLSLNVQNNGSGAMRRVSMDGLDVEQNVNGLSDIHHDFCVVPGGIVAGPSWTGGGMDPPSDLIERSPDGSIRTVVTIGPEVYSSNSYHANAIHYHATDDAYTISDRNPNLYVKVSRQGQVIWQLGGNNPLGASFSGDTSWAVNHGHDFTPDGHFLIFNNNGRGGGGGGGGFGGGASLILEYLLDEGSMTAELIWEFSGENGAGSPTLGDVQRLPNGNTLITYSNSGIIHEVDPSGAMVQAITGASSFGYTMHRPSLYGPPPKSR